MAESKTARASRVAIGETKKDPFDTSEKKIAELRKQRENKLFVNRVDFIDALLEAYDASERAVAHLGGSTASLLQRAETAEEELRNARSEVLRLETQLEEAKTPITPENLPF